MKILPRGKDWEKLQYKVLDALEEDGKSQITAGSGNVKNNGDVLSTHFCAECKLRSTKNISVNIDDYIKTKNSAKYIAKIPLLVNENKDGIILVTLSLEDFENIIRKNIYE